MSGPVVVVGAGPNGLVAATKLARAGRRVTLVERREVVGGLAAFEEIHPGYRVPGPLHDSWCFSPVVAKELGLGTGFADGDSPLLALGGDREPILLSGRPEADLGERDGGSWRGWRSFLDRVGPLLRDVLHRPPPGLAPAGLGELLDLAGRGLALRRLGRDDMTELTRVGTMCVADWLNERFENPLLVEALAAPAVLSTFTGPWSAGTAANLLFHETLRSRPFVGGTATLLDALKSAAESAGVELRTGSRVREIPVSDGRVSGAVLESGDRIDARVVVATCDPRQAILDLLDPRVLAAETERQLRVLRARGTTAQVRLALDGPLEFEGFDGEVPERIHLGGGHVDELERAFDAAKYRRWAEKPHLDIRWPTLSNPGLAPDGGHVVSILASAAPIEIDGGWTDAERSRLEAAVLDRLTEHAPTVRDRIVAVETLSPADVEERYGTTGGHLHHGEHALDQLLMLRPGPCASGYATPIGGLFLGGSGTHPGGGLTGIPGLLAAGAVLRRT